MRTGHDGYIIACLEQKRESEGEGEGEGRGGGCWSTTLRNMRRGTKKKLRRAMGLVLEEIEQSTGLRPSRSIKIRDQSSHDPLHPPQAIFQITTEDEISKILKVCNRHKVKQSILHNNESLLSLLRSNLLTLVMKVPVIPVAGRTSLEGHILPMQPNTIIIDVSGMDKILNIHSSDMDVVVQPGIGWMELKGELEPHGLFFPPDPGASACIGGMCGTNCSGTLAFRYGIFALNFPPLFLFYKSSYFISPYNSLPAFYINVN
jgi:hypothetical protein